MATTLVPVQLNRKVEEFLGQKRKMLIAAAPLRMTLLQHSRAGS